MADFYERGECVAFLENAIDQFMVFSESSARGNQKTKRKIGGISKKKGRGGYISQMDDQQYN